ncbi:hypothetical protein DFH08DRAFT_827633 [Mycena albidolilacea]|uniref:Uncharacterized protein n=1 Tax=Mycena albidolilacea TaxID=1033008 RepID=A0AAD6YXR2_9AGAR|nr:hypothetical protein DFH08DRAFT_827633 [Mycena albidolilacea]
MRSVIFREPKALTRAPSICVSPWVSLGLNRISGSICPSVCWNQNHNTVNSCYLNGITTIRVGSCGGAQGSQASYLSDRLLAIPLSPVADRCLHLLLRQVRSRVVVALKIHAQSTSSKEICVKNPREANREPRRWGRRKKKVRRESYQAE